MVPETKLCSCGEGTITYLTEMDDWNRFRYETQVNCPTCKAEVDEKSRLEHQRECNREEQLSKAREIAKSRYLDRWLAMYEGLSKREAWLLYTGGVAYPALGTFYKHVRKEGVEAYIRQNFSHDFQKALCAMGIRDDDIEKLIAEENDSIS